MRYLFILFKIFTEMNYSIDFSSYKEYDNPQEMSNLYYEWTKDINEKRDNRIHAIEEYCGQISRFINSRLRGDESVYPYDDVLETIQTLLIGSPSLPTNTILYRALPLCVIERMILETKTQGFYRDKGFLSTSLNIEGISNVKDVPIAKIINILRLYVPEGTHGLYIEDIKGEGMGRGELEVILPRNSKIIMINQSYKENEYGYRINECILEYDNM